MSSSISKDGRFFEADADSQLLAIRGLLRSAKAWRDELTDQADAACEAGWGAEAFTEHAYGSTAYSQAAVGSLAPFFEGLFWHGFQVLKHCLSDQIDVDRTHHRWRLGELFWNPNKWSKRGELHSKDYLLRGSEQLLRVLRIKNRFPADFEECLQALFDYRNAALHHGNEWADDRRIDFSRALEDRGWKDKWFTIATVGGEPWMFAMTDEFIERCLNVASAAERAFWQIAYDWRMSATPDLTLPSWMKPEHLESSEMSKMLATYARRDDEPPPHSV